MKKFQLNNTMLSELFKKLALFLQAGIQPGDGLAILADEEEEKKLKQFYTQCSLCIDEGEPLAVALSRFGEIPEYATSLLSIGEKVGRTEETLISLSKYFDHRARLTHQLRQALVYPSILFVIMAAVIVILLCQVLPVFSSVYASLGGSLTGLAAGLLKFGEGLEAALPYIGIVIAVVMLSACVIMLCDKAKNAVKKVIVRSASDNGISKKINSAHFAQAVAMSIGSGMTIEEAIYTAGTLLTDSPKAAARCNACCDRIANGEEPFKALRDADILPSSACRMLMLGMRAGKADETMWEIAERLTDDADDALNEKISQVEPALVLITSVLVGVILLSVMIPLVDIMKVI